jgi:glutamate synthase domain-containing protein 2/CDGSH-type Zn-finger protein/rubredoxin
MTTTKREKPRIEATLNGPYAVRNLKNFNTSRGESLETAPEMRLCRCGHSSHKPFCDGTHKKVGFSSEKLEGRVPDRLDNYEGKAITIHDNRGVCSHAGYCIDNLPSVFIMGKEPWIDPDGASAEEIARVIKMCPSGALSYTKDGVLYKDQAREPTITLSKNGPHRVTGGPELKDVNNSTPESQEHYTLCRCGGSKNKPFCDGTHWYINFRDDEEKIPNHLKVNVKEKGRERGTRYRCNVCNMFEYDETRGDSSTSIKPGTKPDEFPDDWRCPICGSDKSHLVHIKEEPKIEAHEAEVTCPQCGAKTKISFVQPAKVAITRYLGEWERDADDLETHMADIHRISVTRESLIEPMRTKKPVISWDDILIMGAQLAKIPLNAEESVNTRTVIGPKAKHPLIIETPIYVTHMSFGALSREVKIALAKGSAAVKTAMCSGEGGILQESRENAYKYIFEYVPNRYSVTDENLRTADAIEIKIGQSTKPGMGGHLPAEKVTKEIAGIRGFPEGTDIVSPAHFDDIITKEDLKRKVAWLREKSDGKPIGVKIAAGNIEADLEVAVYAQPDFITIDGRPGGTGASPKFVKDATSVPTLFALYRARTFLNERGIKDISLVITGGLRVSSDFAKALALGADAVAIGTAALMACACQQYRLCDTGNCPVGVTTHDPALRARLQIEISAKKLENFLHVSTEELKDFARLTGNDDVHNLSITDLCTTNSEISNYTDIKHV